MGRSTDNSRSMIKQTRRSFLGQAVGGAMGAALAPSLAGCGSQSHADRPNFFIIMADDLGIDGLSCYGGETLSTPHINSLAQTGMQFENVYSTPLCTPSRVELMTGMYPFRTGWDHNIDHLPAAEARDEMRFVDPGLGTFAQRLRDAGYATAVAGKWQLCHFEERPDHIVECGFDEYCCWYWTVDGKATNRYWNPELYQDGKAVPRSNRSYGPDIFSEYLLRFAVNHDDQPWLAYYPMVLPHKPYVLPPTDVQEGGIDRRMNADAAKFPAMVSYLDSIVGQVVRSLDHLGQREKTYILFLSDNGTPREIGLRFRGRDVHGGKGTPSERGMRVPLIVSRPGTVREGVVDERLLDLSDLYPTLLDLGGVEVDDERDGQSFAAALRGEQYSGRPWAFSQLGDVRSLRKGSWKYYSDGRLFNLDQDSFEEQNRFSDASAVEVRDEMRNILQDLG